MSTRGFISGLSRRVRRDPPTVVIGDRVDTMVDGIDLESLVESAARGDSLIGARWRVTDLPARWLAGSLRRAEMSGRSRRRNDSAFATAARGARRRELS